MALVAVAGDVVVVTIKASGVLQVYANGHFQAAWNAEIPTEQPLYPVFGMRAPMVAMMARQRDYSLDSVSGGKRVVYVRLIGWLID